MPELTLEDLDDWEHLEITRLFFEYVKVLLEDADNHVHSCLEENKKEEAALFNAGMVQIKEIMDIPERMKDDIKEE